MMDSEARAETDTRIQETARPKHDLLRAHIAAFLHRRRIEAMAAATFVAMTSYSQAYALSLSELKVKSTLGQPLRATINLRTQPGDEINRNCISITQPKNSGMPGVGDVSLSLASGNRAIQLNINGHTPLREPMAEMVLSVNCDGSPALTRTFLVMLDPPSPAPVISVPAAQTAATPPRATGAVPTRSSREFNTFNSRAPVASGDLIPAGSLYTVNPGDVLSVIASRVANRPDYTVWPIAQRIYDTNPSAFLSQAPDSLMVGATLKIPELTGALAVAGSPRQVRQVRARGASARPAPTRVAATRPNPVSSTAQSSGGVTTAAVGPSRAPVVEVYYSLSMGPASSPAPSATASTSGTPLNTPLPRAINTFEVSDYLSALSVDRLRARRRGAVAVGSVASRPVTRPTDAMTRREDDNANGAVESDAADKATEAPRDVAVSAAALAAATGREATAGGTNVEFGRYDPTAEAESAGFALPFDVRQLALLALGALLAAFGIRKGLAMRRSRAQAAQERAERHEQRLVEARQKRPEQAIFVEEDTAPVDLENAVMGAGIEAVGSVAEVLASADPDDVEIRNEDPSGTEDASLTEDTGESPAIVLNDSDDADDQDDPLGFGQVQEQPQDEAVAVDLSDDDAEVGVFVEDDELADAQGELVEDDDIDDTSDVVVLDDSGAVADLPSDVVAELPDDPTVDIVAGTHGASEPEIVIEDSAAALAGDSLADELSPDPEATALLTREQLGITEQDTTQLMSSALDLELPEDDPTSEVVVDELEELGELDTGLLEDELTEMAIQLNSDLLNVPYGDDDKTEDTAVHFLDMDMDDDSGTARALGTEETGQVLTLETSDIRKLNMAERELTHDDEDDDATVIASGLK
ncbi:MAG: hypothetical protein AAF610_05340 [Pseudomonadota bacterium]